MKPSYLSPIPRRILCPFELSDGPNCMHFGVEGKCNIPTAICPVEESKQPIGRELEEYLSEVQEVLDAYEEDETAPVELSAYNPTTMTCPYKNGGTCTTPDTVPCTECTVRNEWIDNVIINPQERSALKNLPTPEGDQLPCEEGCKLTEESEELCSDCLNQQAVHTPEQEQLHQLGVPKQDNLETCLETKDDIEQPSHYTEGPDSGIECWDWYELAMTADEFRGAMKANVWKYTYRAGKKEDKIKDLRKAIAYLERWITYELEYRTVWMKGRKNVS